MFRDRSVIEIMILVFVFIVAFALVGLGVMIVVIEVNHPDADTALLANSLMSLVSGILGALLGLIAGKTEALEQDLTIKPSQRREDEQAEEERAAHAAHPEWWPDPPPESQL